MVLPQYIVNYCIGIGVGLIGIGTYWDIGLLGDQWIGIGTYSALRASWSIDNLICVQIGVLTNGPSRSADWAIANWANSTSAGAGPNTIFASSASVLLRPPWVGGQNIVYCIVSLFEVPSRSDYGNV